MCRYDCGMNLPTAASAPRVLALALSLLAFAQPLRAEDPESPDTSQNDAPTFDPLAGMDPDGRIPKVELPPELRNPERWRYIPEGRILEGNVFERFLVSSFISPLFFFESDVGFGGGVAVTDIDFRNQRRREFAGIVLTHTTEGQQAYTVNWRRWLDHVDLPDGGVAQEERSFVRANGGYSKTLTRRFFGIGKRTRKRNETSYTDELATLNLGFQKSIPHAGDNVVLSLGVGWEHHNLSQGEASGEPSTHDVFPELFDMADSHHAGWVSGGLRYDTRDSQHNPYDGFTVGASARAAPLQTDFDMGAVYRLSASGVVSLPPLFHDGGDDNEENPPTDTLAIGAYIEDAAGNLPFYALPSLGGANTLRGYIQNRWVDNTAWHAAAEYRFWFIPRGFRFTDTIRIERIGAAIFGEMGGIGSDIGPLFRAPVLYSYGFGLRFGLERAALLRADFGFSREDFNFTFNFGLSF